MNGFVYAFACIFWVVASASVARSGALITKKSVGIPFFVILQIMFFGPGAYAQWDWQRHCSTAGSKIFNTKVVDKIYSNSFGSTDAEYLLNKGYDLIETKNSSYNRSQYPVRKYFFGQDHQVISELSKFSTANFKVMYYSQMVSDSLEVFGYKIFDSDRSSEVLSLQEGYRNHGGYIWRWATKVAGMGTYSSCPNNTNAIDLILNTLPPYDHRSN